MLKHSKSLMCLTMQLRNNDIIITHTRKKLHSKANGIALLCGLSVRYGIAATQGLLECWSLLVQSKGRVPLANIEWRMILFLCKGNKERASSVPYYLMRIDITTFYVESGR